MQRLEEHRVLVDRFTDSNGRKEYYSHGVGGVAINCSPTSSDYRDFCNLLIFNLLLIKSLVKSYR